MADQAVAALFLTLLEEREVLVIDGERLEIQLAAQDHQVDTLLVSGNVEVGHRVDVGKLVACRIDADVVRVSLEHDHVILGYGARRVPGVQYRHLVVLVGEVVGRVPLDPRLEPGFLSHRLSVRVVVLVELLHVMRRREGREAARIRQPHRHRRHRRGVDVLHGVVVDLHQGAVVFLVDPSQVAGNPARLELVVVLYVIQPVEEVVRREGGAVRPLRARSQLHRGDQAVWRNVQALGQIRDDSAGIRIEAEQRRAGVPLHVADRPGRECRPHVAAVLADLVEHRDDEGLGWQPLLDGRELAAQHQLGQLGGLVELQRRWGRDGRYQLLLELHACQGLLGVHRRCLGCNARCLRGHAGSLGCRGGLLGLLDCLADRLADDLLHVGSRQLARGRGVDDLLHVGGGQLTTG